MSYIDRYWIARLRASVPKGYVSDLIDFHVRRAHAADKYRKATGYRHPDWGNGSFNDQLFHSYKTRLNTLKR